MPKTQPWKKAWPPAPCQEQQQDQHVEAAAVPIEYGVAAGSIVVVDGTASNVKPAAPLRSLPSERTAKTQPWKASWTSHSASAAAAAAVCATGNVDYGVVQGETVVVDGTAANVKPSAKVQA